MPGSGRHTAEEEAKSWQETGSHVNKKQVTRSIFDF